MDLRNTFCERGSEHFTEYFNLIVTNGIEWPRVGSLNIHPMHKKYDVLSVHADGSLRQYLSEELPNGIPKFKGNKSQGEPKNNSHTMLILDSEREAHLCNMLLRKCRGESVQVSWDGLEWRVSTSSYINIDLKYRIPPKKINIPWELIEDKYIYFAAEKDGEAFLYLNEPYMRINETWGGNCSKCQLKIDVDGIDWKDTKTMRPK